MSRVNTVLGPADSGDLGFTLSHERLTLAATDVDINAIMVDNPRRFFED